MKIGYQTIIWGGRFDNIESALDAIAAAGYRGVEFAQRPQHLPPLHTLLEMLKKRGLAFLGLAGGMLWERVEYCGNIRPLYLYVEDWNEDAPDALKRGFTLALHPHAYKAVHRLSDARALLAKHPDLKWMPDVAHTSVVGDDPVAALHLAEDRMSVVHFKDWTAAYGRSAHRFARGFTELGRGELPLHRMLEELDRMKYDGWLVVEQDSPTRDPYTSLWECAQWLADRKLLPRPPASPAGDATLLPWPRYPALSSVSAASHLRFTQSMIQAASNKGADCYQIIIKSFKELFSAQVVTMMAVSPNALSLLATAPEGIEWASAPASGLTLRGTLTAVALEMCDVATFDLTSPCPGATFRRPEAKFAFDVLGNAVRNRRFTGMVVIPLLNPYNANLPRSVVCLLFDDSAPTMTEEDCFWLGVEAARAADSSQDEDCAYATGRARLLTGTSRGSKEFIQANVRLIKELVGCEGCSAFLLNETEDRLELAASTGIEWTVPEDQRFYLRDEGLVGKTWLRNEAILSADPQQDTDSTEKSHERAQSDSNAVLIAPVADSEGRVIGVIRCRNKRPVGIASRNLFSDNDVSVVESVSQVAVPHLQVLVAEERRAKGVMRLTHEARQPDPDGPECGTVDAVRAQVPAEVRIRPLQV